LTGPRSGVLNEIQSMHEIMLLLQEIDAFQ
jgi:hypothetical protein